ncbi:mucoidy inhibitor MuiA family protein [Maritimibacter sp. DP1N21-5]|uniref:mucoidy inhibitor MuiA family protein n=1 Tax=Maritimibacter sp. DP1N21-5 TaxID=2836867 RepID=UPI001C43A406|nr:mucoidy inhibitor MuiA family protein [Maritimibacter sp. DP1N21-5]MBV7407590.1 DUF4139 domain-containing protein [Maritimibacter sp. DP1N21-5]
MRVSVSLLALLAATPALADSFYAQAPVAAAVIYPDGATLTLRAEVELPAGTHDVMIPYPGAAASGALPRVATSEGVVIGALGFREDRVADPTALYSPAQRAALEAVEAAEEEAEAKRDELALAQTEIAALKARLDYLAAIAPPEAGTAEEILAVADLVSNQTLTTQAALEEARKRLRPLTEEMDELTAAVEAAQAALDRLAPPGQVNEMLTVEVTAAEAGPVTLELTEQTWNAGWRVDYDVNLDRAAGVIDLDRKIVVMQETDRAWTDVAMTFSTARPSDRIAPSEVWPDLADIYDPAPPMPLARDGAADFAREEMMAVAEPAPAEMKTAGLVVDGLAVTYVYPDPVTIVPGEAAELALDTLTLDAETTIEAAPRYDETAFLVADIVNVTGEPILPGTASISRDGYLVGQTDLALIPAGAEETLAFGPIESIRLDTIFKRNAEGDRGIISRSSNRRQEITFTVENLSNETQEVRALFPLTFSEKEELDVTVTATPAPDETDVEDRRGVSAWDLTVAPGETRTVEIVVDLDWPEGKELGWNP